MVVEVNCIYDGKYEGNILVAGRTGCEKTTVMQNLAKNKMFGVLKEVICSSKLLLSKDEKVVFKYLETNNEFENLLEHLQKKKISCNKNSLGENIENDHLVVLDDVSGLADRLEIFPIFFTVSRKFGLTCVYVFHALYPTKTELANDSCINKSI